MALLTPKRPTFRAEVVPTAAARPPRKRRPLLAILSAAWLGIVVLAIVLEPFLGLPDPATSDYANVALGPFASSEHWLGTDLIGRDILARLITGAQVSLVVGIGAVVVGVLIGGIVGIVAGFFGGWADRVLGGVVDVLLAFPPLVATIALTVFLGASLQTIVLAIGIVFAPQLARVARSATLTYAHREFVVAARGTGATNLRILVREILPNTVAPILAYATVMVAVGITAEAGISFLGLGVPAPQSSWGTMLGENRSALTADPHMVLIPAFTMFVTLLSLNFLSEYFGRRFDIREAVL